MLAMKKERSSFIRHADLAGAPADATHDAVAIECAEPVLPQECCPLGALARVLCEGVAQTNRQFGRQGCLTTFESRDDGTSKIGVVEFVVRNRWSRSK